VASNPEKLTFESLKEPVMRKMFVVVVLIAAASTLVLGQASQNDVGQSSNAEQTVLRLTGDWIAAEGKHDRPALDRIIATVFEGTGPGGNAVTKSDIVPRDGSEAGGISMNGQDLKARAFGDTAVVTGRGLRKGQTGELRFTLVYARRQDRWQMVAAHLSVIPQE
jgi:hypothetical protein